MADKINKKLTMGERFVLLNNIPKEGDLVTFKILRKLRETLAPSETEIKEYGFQNSYRCPHREYDEKGKAFQCEVEETAKEPPKCPIHNVFMQPTGRVSWSPEKWNTEKEIWFGQKANQIIMDTLKKVSEEDKKINDDIIASLYEKFVKAEEEED
jgi:hypothetical protein